MLPVVDLKSHFIHYKKFICVCNLLHVIFERSVVCSVLEMCVACVYEV